MATVNQPDAKPTRKVTVGALTGLGVTFVVALLNQFEVPVSEELAAAGVTFFSALASYLAKERA